MQRVGEVERPGSTDEILWDIESDRVSVTDTWSVGEGEFLSELWKEHATEFILGDVSVAIQDRAYQAHVAKSVRLYPTALHFLF